MKTKKWPEVVIVVTWLVAVGLCFELLDRTLSLVLRSFLGHSQQRFFRQYYDPPHADILILGNSRGVNAFYSPAIGTRTGLKVFNLSYNGMSTEIASAFFEDYLDRNEPPKLLILEISSLVSDNGLLADLKLFSENSRRVAALIDRDFPVVSVGSQISSLFALNSELTMRGLFYYGKTDQDWINQYTISEVFVRSLTRTRILNFPGEVSETNWSALRNILSIAAQRGIDVRLVLSPYLPKYLQIQGGVSGWLQELHTRLGGNVTIYDYTELPLANSAFADTVHMNLRGSTILLEKMFSEGVFAIK